MTGAVSAVAASTTFASIATVAKGVAAIAGGISAVRSLTSRPSAPQMQAPTLTAAAPNISDTPQTKLSQVQAVRQDAADRARSQAAATAKQNQTNLTSGLTRVSDEEQSSGTSRAKRTALGV